MADVRAGKVLSLRPPEVSIAQVEKAVAVNKEDSGEWRVKSQDIPQTVLF